MAPAILIIITGDPYDECDLETSVFKGIFYGAIQLLLDANNKFYGTILTFEKDLNFDF